ncbi:MAG TPA: prepilin peptidase [Solirubrobacterales bacterium]|nr:prepilin peptidase [Solirubrobacterales bacterium]
MAAIATFGFLGGAVTGSFLSVVAHRVPRGESIVGPRSRCASCGAQIAAYDNIPILSWLLLRGHCRHCGERISPRYPLIELATGLLFAVTVLVLRHDPAELVLGLVFVATLAAITLTDLELRVIPNKVLIVSAVSAVILAAVLDPSSLPERAIAAAAAGGLLFAVALAYPRGMGMGDVKLAAVMGLYLGRSVAPALLIAFLAGSLFGLALIARHGTTARKQAVPFGPFLAFGGVIGLLAGDQLVDWYLGTFS